MNLYTHRDYKNKQEVVEAFFANKDFHVMTERSIPEVVTYDDIKNEVDTVLIIFNIHHYVKISW